MRELTLSDIERLRAETGSHEAVTLEMDEDTFRGFYERTARALRAYLARITGDSALADDLLQESYYRFLRGRAAYTSEAHRRNALFRIATNLARDSYRRSRHRVAVAPLDTQAAAPAAESSEAAERRTDVRRALVQLKPRDRELLWLAYAQGASHREIAECLGLRVGSVKLLLFRARRRLAALLRGTLAPGLKGNGP